MATFQVSDGDFESEVLKSEVPVVVDFWAEWCGPCKQIAPTLEELSDEYGGAVRIAKVNVDENQDWAARLGVRGIPALYIVKNGEIVADKSGVAPKAALKSWIDANI